MKKEQFYISFNPDEPGGGGGSAEVTISAEEHKALLDNTAKLEAAVEERKKAEEELTAKIKLLEEEKIQFQKDKETAEKRAGKAEMELKKLEDKI